MSKLNKCDFCSYFVGRSCAYGLNQNNPHPQCHLALSELYKYLDLLKRKDQHKKQINYIVYYNRQINAANICPDYPENRISGILVLKGE